jgi:Protein of unknown function (DUF938)
VTPDRAGSLPYSQSCENNKASILAQLRTVFADRKEVLELGAGTGQHATWFAGHMPWLRWQPTDVEANLATLKLRCALFEGDNLLPARAFDVSEQPWLIPVPGAVFTANSLHIMPFTAVESLFAGLARGAARDTLLVVYGPFNYGGQYTSASNARFDQWLAEQHPLSAIRHFEQVNTLAQSAGFRLEQDCEMPANNRLLVWCKSTT